MDRDNFDESLATRFRNWKLSNTLSLPFSTVTMEELVSFMTRHKISGNFKAKGGNKAIHDLLEEKNSRKIRFKVEHRTRKTNELIPGTTDDSYLVWIVMIQYRMMRINIFNPERTYHLVPTKNALSPFSVEEKFVFGEGREDCGRRVFKEVFGLPSFASYDSRCFLFNNVTDVQGKGKIEETESPDYPGIYLKDCCYLDYSAFLDVPDLRIMADRLDFKWETIANWEARKISIDKAIQSK